MKNLRTIKVFQNGKVIFDGLGTHTVPMRNIGEDIQDRYSEFTVTDFEENVIEFSGFDLVLVSKLERV